MFWEAQMMVDPMTLQAFSNLVYQRWRECYQMMQPIMIALFRPSISETYPEIKAPSHEPAGIAAVIPPWTLLDGPEHVSASLNPGPFGP